MTFIQIVSFHCTHLDDLREIEQEWLDTTEGRRTLLKETLLADRNDPTHFVTLNEFASYESATENSELQETQRMARAISTLLTGEPAYLDLDVLQVSEFGA